MAETLRDVAKLAVDGATPATESGDTCFIPRYVIDRLRVALHEDRTGLEGFVPMPRNADEAAAMAVLGDRWLQDNAPERLRTSIDARAAACVAACAGIPTQALQGAHFEAADDESPLYELVADEEPACPKCHDTGLLNDMLGAEHRPDTWERCDCPKGAERG